jgi:hypothetical protein
MYPFWGRKKDIKCLQPVEMRFTDLMCSSCRVYYIMTNFVYGSVIL